MDRIPAEFYNLYGDEEADRQHRELFKKYEEFMTAINGNITREELLKLLEQMRRYSMTHFATEEKLFDAYGYPDAGSHAEEHREFVIELWTLKAKIEDEATLSDTLRLAVKSLVHWLSHHVSKTDVAAGEFIRKCKGPGR